MRRSITFNRPKLVSFKRAIEAAIMRKEETFSFEGEQFFVDYAQYFARYIEEAFDRLNEANKTETE